MKSFSKKWCKIHYRCRSFELGVPRKCSQVLGCSCPLADSNCLVLDSCFVADSNFAEELDRNFVVAASPELGSGSGRTEVLEFVAARRLERLSSDSCSFELVDMVSQLAAVR